MDLVIDMMVQYQYQHQDRQEAEWLRQATCARSGTPTTRCTALHCWTDRDDTSAWLQMRWARTVEPRAN
jgi:hypothetical protein